MKFLFKHRYLLLRRFVQIGILVCFVLGNYSGLKLLRGDYSSSLLLDTVPLSDPFAFLQLLAAGGAIGTDVLIGAASVFFLYALIGGRVFCSWVCPMNIVTDLAGFLRVWAGFERLKQNLLFSRNIRYYVIVLALILSSVFGILAYEAISPLGVLQRSVIFGMGFGFTLTLGVFLFDLLALKNGFCGHICPLGGFYAVFSRFSLLRIRYESSKCTHCMRCKEICPEKQVLDAVGKAQDSTVSSGECTRCGRCIEVCNDNAISFSITSFIKKDKKYENNID